MCVLILATTKVTPLPAVSIPRLYSVGLLLNLSLNILVPFLLSSDMRLVCDHGPIDFGDELSIIVRMNSTNNNMLLCVSMLQRSLPKRAFYE